MTYSIKKLSFQTFFKIISGKSELNLVADVFMATCLMGVDAQQDPRFESSVDSSFESSVDSSFESSVDSSFGSSVDSSWTTLFQQSYKVLNFLS